MALSTAGAFMLAGVYYKADGRLACEHVRVITDGENIAVADRLPRQGRQPSPLS